jgi:hypothetical protein
MLSDLVISHSDQPGCNFHLLIDVRGQPKSGLDRFVDRRRLMPYARRSG